MNTSFLLQTVERNLRELKDADLMLLVLENLENTLHPLNFFAIVSVALYNDVISHLCKVYEIDSSGRSFWYIEKKMKTKINDIAQNHSISIETLKDISERLKNIRNKTHFHIGSDNPNVPKLVWEEYEILNSEIRYLISSGYSILIQLYERMSKKSYHKPDYNGTDIKEIISSYIEKYPECGIIVT